MGKCGKNGPSDKCTSVCCVYSLIILVFGCGICNYIPVNQVTVSQIGTANRFIITKMNNPGERGRKIVFFEEK